MTSVHAGHRARMRERYRAGGASSLASHELLEMLLYHALAQRDTNPLAHALLSAQIVGENDAFSILHPR